MQYTLHINFVLIQTLGSKNISRLTFDKHLYRAREGEERGGVLEWIEIQGETFPLIDISNSNIKCIKLDIFSIPFSYNKHL